MIVCRAGSPPEGTGKRYRYPIGVLGRVTLAVEDPDTMDEEEPQDFGYRLCLSWRGDAQEIIKALNDQGLATDWDGSNTTRIAILPANGVEDEEA